MSETTTRRLAAVRHTRPREYLTYDELLNALIDEYLSRKPTLRAQVERLIADPSFRPGIRGLYD